MTRIGLVDVDGHGYPNLALMKLSAYWKREGATVEMAVPFGEYDKVFMSKVFSFTPDCTDIFFADEVEKGGTGYGDYTKVLPPEIEHIRPDYSLYPDGKNSNLSYGFTTRGCIRSCSFCLVSKKEGKIHENADFREFYDPCTRGIVLFDNNIVAHPHGIKQLETIRDMRIPVDCNQGLDARILCKSEYLMDLVADLAPLDTRGIRIACDQKSEIEPCHKVIQHVLKRNPKAIFVVYCILTDDMDDSLNRVMQWRRYGHSVAVYAPPYRNFDDPYQVIPRWQKDLSRWASNHFIYYGMSWDEYKRTKGRRDREFFTPEII